MKIEGSFEPPVNSTVLHDGCYDGQYTKCTHVRNMLLAVVTVRCTDGICVGRAKMRECCKDGELGFESG